jgi:hypothetical protein
LAVSGEPLARRHGVVLYSAQSTYGTAVTPATGVGIFNTSHTQHSSNTDFRGPGSANFVARKGLSTYTEWSLRSEGLQTGSKTLLLKAQRTAGVMPLITLGIGYQDDGTPTRSADQIQDCKIGSMSLGLDASSGHAPLSCELSGVGGLITVLTTLAPALLTTTPWDTSEGVVTLAAGAYALRTFSVQTNQNLSRDHVIPGAAPSSFKRGHAYLTEHDESISGSISRYLRSGVSIQADTITQQAMVVVLTNRVDSATLTLTFATVDFDNEKLDEDQNGLFWSADFTAKTLVMS